MRCLRIICSRCHGRSRDGSSIDSTSAKGGDHEGSDGFHIDDSCLMRCDRNHLSQRAADV